LVEIANTGVTLRQLQIFREVVRLGSERQAAKVLRVTQSAVSQQVAQLETALTVPLFRREGNRLVATAQAWELLREIDGTFLSLDRVGKSIAALKGIEGHAIGIAAPDIFCFTLVPRAVRQIRVDDRSCVFHVKSGSYQDVAEHVLNGRADLGLSRLPLDERLFDWMPVATATNVCLFPAGHRLGEKDLITPEDLRDEPMIDIEPRQNTHQMDLNALRYMGVEPNIAVEVDANGHEAAFIAAGIGISVTNSIVAKECAFFGLQFRPFEPSAIYHYVVFWQRGRKLSGQLQLARERLADALRDPA
jgi:DNA-binding transcriptional LysR family regulator